MSGEADTTGASAAVPTGLDYRALLDEGVALVQRMSGATWTNYNWSDPGVTTLQQLCYALTELSYRADFPVADLIADPSTGRVALRRQALYPARSILPVNPVTVDDLRRLLVDRISEIGNAWVTPLRPHEAGAVRGLYRIEVLVPGLDPGCEHEGPDPAEVRRRVRDCYTAHRALCEDVAEVVVLRPERARVSAVVQLDDRVDPDRVLAEILFRLGLAMAPEPSRTSLRALRDAGRTSSEIFEGPLMLRGFIADGELGPLPTAIPVDLLLETAAAVPGVLAVDALTVHVRGEAYRPGTVIDVAAGHILALDTRAGEDDIELRHGASICPTNPTRVAKRLARLWADQRRTYPLRPDYQHCYPTPTGRRIDLTAYSSVQRQFPEVYGIGSYGLPARAGASRIAQARQLKGYLMVFDQLMADFFAQLGFVRELMSPAAGGGRTYACQSLRPIVPDAAPLLSPEYEAGLRALVAAQDPVVERQLAILGFLLSLYAEAIEAPADAECGTRTSVPGAALVKARKALLGRTVPATRDRGRGFDYRRRGGDSPVTGLDIRCRIELALLDAMTGAGDARIVEDPAEANFGRLLPPELSAMIAKTFLPVDDAQRETRSSRDARGGSPLGGHRVAAALMPALGDRTRYRVGALPNGHGPVYLVCTDFEGRCWLIAELPDVARAVALADRLVRAAGGDQERLVIVEWTLLRFARAYRPHHHRHHHHHHRHHHHRRDHDTAPAPEGEEGAGVHTPLAASGPEPGGAHASPDPDLPEDFSFRVSAVMAVDADEDDAGWRAQAARIVREAMPAHIVVEDLPLRRRRMRHFRRLHRLWREALRSGPRERLEKTSWHLARFLQRCEPPPPPHPPRVRQSGTAPDAPPRAPRAPRDRFEEDDSDWD